MLSGAATAPGCACPASFRLWFGRAEAVELGAAPAAGGAAPAEPDGGASGRLLGELELRRGGPPQLRLPSRGAPVISAPHTLAPGSGGKPAGVARGRGRPRAEGRGALPGLPTLPLRKWCAALKEVEAALRAGVLLLGELLVTGEVGRALALPLVGRRVAVEWRTASACVDTCLGGDLVPKPGPHAGSRHAGEAAGSPDLCSELC